MRFALLLLLLAATALRAQTVWISDQLRTAVHAEAGINKRFLGSLSAGESVQQLERSRDGEYIKIKKGDLIGWVAARNIMQEPSVHAQWQAQQQELQDLRRQRDEAQQAQQQGRQQLERLQQALQQAQQQEQQARDELLALQRASSHVMAIDRRNRELEQLHAQSEQMNLGLRHRILRLEEALHQRQIYVGAGLLALGFFLHWLLGYLGASRRRYD